jgi:hypothetical protein
LDLWGTWAPIEPERLHWLNRMRGIEMLKAIMAHQ